jgi:hypothetical protein
MMERKQCEFQLIRYVPDPIRNEFVNIGVLLRAGEQSELRFTRDWGRVQCLDPNADTEMLEALEIEIGHRLHAQAGHHPWKIMDLLEASLSNGVQITESKGYLAETFPAGLEELMRMYVEPPRKERGRPRSERDSILSEMRKQFERVGVWKLMRKQIRAAEYTKDGDPLRIDCGYRNGSMRFFQAVSLATDVVDAKVLAYSANRLKEGVENAEGVELELTAIAKPIGWPQDDGEPDSERTERYDYTKILLKKYEIELVTTSDLPRFADAAREEIRA